MSTVQTQAADAKQVVTATERPDATTTLDQTVQPKRVGRPRKNAAAPAANARRTGDRALNAFVIKDGDRFTCVADKNVIGVSRYPDYFEYHYRRDDIRALKGLEIGKFVHLTETGKVSHIVETDKTKSDTSLVKQATQALKVLAKISADSKATAPAAAKSTTKKAKSDEPVEAVSTAVEDEVTA